MKKVLLTLLSLSVCTTAFSQETQESRRARRGEGAYIAGRDATTLSMVGWGFGIAIGIAALCSLIEDNATASASSSTHH